MVVRGLPTIGRDEHYSPFAPSPGPCIPTHGELLYEFVSGHTRVRCELVDHGVEARIPNVSITCPTVAPWHCIRSEDADPTVGEGERSDRASATDAAGGAPLQVVCIPWPTPPLSILRVNRPDLGYVRPDGLLSRGADAHHAANQGGVFASVSPIGSSVLRASGPRALLHSANRRPLIFIASSKRLRRPLPSEQPRLQQSGVGTRDAHRNAPFH